MKNLLKQRPYFEGWYFKHQQDNKVLAFIPGINREKGKSITPFLQIIAGEKSYQLTFPLEECFIDRKSSYIRLGNNVFTKEGIMIDIHTEELTLKGIILYHKLHPIAYNIMGLFRYFPGMECKHDIISMSHYLSGNLTYNGNLLPFHKGIGYIEKDWGHSFPSSYLWLHCNDFTEDICSVMVSIARIPLWGSHFTGCICAIHYRNREYRLATYLGVKILKATPTLIILRQGDYFFRIRIKDTSSPSAYNLAAPTKGKMNRVIKESHLCQGSFFLSYKKQLVFHLKSQGVSLESVTDKADQ